MSQVVKIANNNGGAQALTTLLQHQPELRQAKFDTKDLVKIAGNESGAQALAAALALRSTFDAQHLSNAQVLAVAGVRGSTKTMKLMAVHAQAIQQKNLVASVVAWATAKKITFVSFQQHLIAALDL